MGRYALYEFIMSACLLIVAAVRLARLVQGSCHKALGTGCRREQRAERKANCSPRGGTTHTPLDCSANFGVCKLHALRISHQTLLKDEMSYTVQTAVALGAGVWRYKKCLNQYWLYRYFTAQTLLCCFSESAPLTAAKLRQRTGLLHPQACGPRSALARVSTSLTC